MAKRLTERIAQRVKTKNPRQSGKNRESFLALRNEIKEALNDGWSVKLVWDTLVKEEKISFGYDVFLRYVNEIIRNVDLELDKKTILDSDVKKEELEIKQKQD